MAIVILPVWKQLQPYPIPAPIDQRSIIKIFSDPSAFSSNLFNYVFQRLQTLWYLDVIFTDTLIKFIYVICHNLSLFFVLDNAHYYRTVSNIQCLRWLLGRLWCSSPHWSTGWFFNRLWFIALLVLVIFIVCELLLAFQIIVIAYLTLLIFMRNFSLSTKSASFEVDHVGNLLLLLGRRFFLFFAFWHSGRNTAFPFFDLLVLFCKRVLLSQ